MNTEIFEQFGQIPIDKIKECIPEKASKKPKEGWHELGLMEWRWRFLQLPGEKQVVEISRWYPFMSTREYINKKGRWIGKTIDPSYDDYVIEEWYHYTPLDNDTTFIEEDE